MEAIMEAYECGERDFGESRVQELLPKYEALPKDIRWHFIGHLQTNKVKQIVPFVHMIHSVDSVRLLETINREAEKIQRRVKVLLEVHVAKEETKSGFSPEELLTLDIQLSTFNYVDVCGLMGMATNTDDEAEWRRCFRAIASLASSLIASSPNSLIASSPIENRPAIFYGNMIKEYPDGRRVKDNCGGGDYTPESFYYFYRGTLNHDCAYIRRDLFEKYGLYNEDMKICSDWEWYVRAIVLGGEKTVYTNINVTVFDMTGISESNGKNRDIIVKERREYLESILPAAVLRDYDMFSLPIEQYRRLKKYHLWGIIYFVERVLFKFEKWSK